MANPPGRPALEATLAESRGRFLAFARSRLNDPEAAEDAVQDALLRAVESLEDLRDPERLVPWFYQILRNAIIDAYRRRDVRQRRTTALEEFDIAAEIDTDADRALCECFEALIPTLRPEYGDVLTAVDLGGESPAAVARRLGISENNLKVRRHRARAALRKRLEQTCHTCSVHGCLDCTCDAAPRMDLRVEV